MTTTAAVKVDRADVMKRAWQIYKAKAVRTMQAWSHALRSAWKIVKGGSVVENAPSEKQINFYQELILKSVALPLSRVANDQLIQKSRAKYDRNEYALEMLAVTFVALDLANAVDKSKMSKLIDEAKRVQGVYHCAAMSDVKPEDAMAFWTDEKYDEFFDLATKKHGFLTAATVFAAYKTMRGV